MEQHPLQPPEDEPGRNAQQGPTSPLDQNPDNSHPADPAQSETEQPEDQPSVEAFLAHITAELPDVLADLDARGEALSDYDAQNVATLLATVLGPASELARFARSGEGDREAMVAECAYLRSPEWRISRNWQATDIESWVAHFDRYLDTPLPQPDRLDTGGALEQPTPQVLRGIRGHGDAFLAYLQLPDTDAQNEHILEDFHRSYFGSFPSFAALIDRLTSLQRRISDADGVAENLEMADFTTLNRNGLEDLARATWDFIEIEGRVHVFKK